MPRVRLSLGFALLLGLGCEHETFDLLPPAQEAPQAGMAGGGRGGSGGTGAPTGGRGSPELPTPDCPENLFGPCQPCWTHSDCERGTLCDTYRHYCARFCQSASDCYEPPVCDQSRAVCVECTFDTHCGPLECYGGKCVPPQPPECFTNADCDNPAEPVCFGGQCGACFSSEQCGPGLRCFQGRCDPIMP